MTSVPLVKGKLCRGVAGAGFEPAQAEPTPLQIAVNVVLTCRQTQLLFSDPVLIAGVATTKFELHTTARTADVTRR